MWFFKSKEERIQQLEARKAELIAEEAQLEKSIRETEERMENRRTRPRPHGISSAMLAADLSRVSGESARKMRIGQLEITNKIRKIEAKILRLQG